MAGVREWRIRRDGRVEPLPGQVGDFVPAHRHPQSRDLTESLINRLVECTLAGLTASQVAKACGVPPTQYARWLNQGEIDDRDYDPERPYTDTPLRQFYLRIQEAEGACAREAIEEVRNAGRNGTWQASTWFLERRFPAEYGRQRLEISGPDGGPIEQSMRVTELTDEELLQILQQDSNQ